MSLAYHLPDRLKEAKEKGPRGKINPVEWLRKVVVFFTYNGKPNVNLFVCLF